MKKGLKIFLIVLVLILICGAGVGGWVLGTKYANKEDSKKVEKKKEEKKEEETKEEEKEPKKDIEPPVLPFPRAMCAGYDFDFQEKTIYAKDISDDDKLKMLSFVLLDFNQDDEAEDIDDYNIDDPLELDFDLIEVAEKYFDVTPSMKKKMEEGFGNDGASFIYKNGKTYYVFLPGGCEGAGQGGHELEEKGEKKEGNTLIKSYYYYYVKISNEFVEEKDEDGNTYYNYPTFIYKNKKDKNPVYKDIEDMKDIDFSKFNTYDVYFDTTGGNMKLEKIVFNKK